MVGYHTVRCQPAGSEREQDAALHVLGLWNPLDSRYMQLFLPRTLQQCMWELTLWRAPMPVSHGSWMTL